MTPWEFMACVDGYRRANGAKPANAAADEITEEQLAEMGIVGF